MRMRMRDWFTFSAGKFVLFFRFNHVSKIKNAFKVRKITNPFWVWIRLIFAHFSFRSTKRCTGAEFWYLSNEWVSSLRRTKSSARACWIFLISLSKALYIIIKYTLIKTLPTLNYLIEFKLGNQVRWIIFDFTWYLIYHLKSFDWKKKLFILKFASGGEKYLSLWSSKPQHFTTLELSISSLSNDLEHQGLPRMFPSSLHQ